MRSYLRRIATKARRALNVLAIAACSCHADPSPLSNDGSPNASVPIALERAGAPMVHVRVLRLAYPAEGVVEERRRCIAELTCSAVLLLQVLLLNDLYLKRFILQIDLIIE